ncbi:MAG: hypothetical protein HY952_08670 [Elusimicrobia bacterium]|nr:hypothetical protein [Elusimicrobiota bacterium]
MHSAYFDFHGCRVVFRSPEPSLADWLAADFSAFSAPETSGGIEISAVRAAPNPASLPPALVRTGRWRLLAAPPGQRLVWYPQGAVSRYDYTAESGRIESGDPELLKELSYLLILSRVGEKLDGRGLHRIHAGALAHGDKGLLFCGRQGAGKTTLLLELLQDPAFALLSDDTPLVSAGGDVYPFQVRVGIGEDSPHLGRFPAARRFTRRHYEPKRLLSPADAGRVAQAPVPPSAVFLLRRGAAPRLSRARTSAAASELLRSLAAGLGVPQMAEYFLRLSPADAAQKAGIAASRLRACAALFRKTSFWMFETGPDPAANAAVLRDFLRNNSGAACAR